MSFSVVTPNFNHGKVLARAVDAVMAQEPRPAEIIIINDGSTDDSLAVIGALQTRYPAIRLINHEQNRGVLAGMNEGLRAASAEFVYMAAADDFALPGLFAAASAALQQHPDAAYFCGRVVLFDPQGRILGVRPFMQPSAGAAFVSPAAARAELAKSDNWSVGAGVIYRRRRLLAAGGFDETMGAFGDGLMVRRLALESGFCFDPALVAAWEIYPESLSARSALSVAENTRLIDRAVAAVKATFPADIRESYADRLERRLRFNMARLWLVFHTQTIDTIGLSEVLQFKGPARTGLDIAARLPFARLAVLAWTAMVLRPYGIGAVLVGYWRAIAARWFELPRLRKVFAALHRHGAHPLPGAS
jgi:glycosyltransferase involved in cell wall biosynthesis